MKNSKQCSKCERTRYLKFFDRSKTNKGGFQNYCKDCRREHNILWKKRNPGRVEQLMRRRYEAWRQLIIKIKDNPCVDCRQSFPTCVMDFDHVRGKKKFQLSQAQFMSEKSLLVEIAKCDLVCANCHRVRTDKRRTTRWVF